MHTKRRKINDATSDGPFLLEHFNICTVKHVIIELDYIKVAGVGVYVIRGADVFLELFQKRFR